MFEHYSVPTKSQISYSELLAKDRTQLALDRTMLAKERNNLALGRTELAIARTQLANERTLLGYIRTSLTVLAAAVTLIQFFESKIFIILGYCLIPFGLILLLLGYNSYSFSNKVIKTIAAQNTQLVNFMDATVFIRKDKI